MPTHSVNVSGIALDTTEAHLNEFFSFCGSITSIEVHEKDKIRSAVIHFEKPSAAKTALMLNGGTLDGAQLHVSSEIAHEDEEREEGAPIDQTDKPRAGIAAEYLSRGYSLGDHILQRAIDMDHKQGISKRFLNYMRSLDSGLGARALGPDQTISGKLQSHITSAAQQVKTMDEQKGYTKTAHEYYKKALSSPIGNKVLDFWTTTSKQVLDIHEEARRMADAHKATNQAPDPALTTSDATKGT